MEQIYENVAQELGIDQTKLKMETKGNNGHYLRLPKQKQRLVTGKKASSKWIVLETRKDGVRFTTAKFRKYSEHYDELLSAYRKKQSEIVAQIMTVTKTYLEPLIVIGKVVEELDVYLSFAHVAELGGGACSAEPYVRPKMLPMGSGKIILNAARHPCVEIDDTIDFIPNDCIMKYETSRFQIITGPNMGGKSTYIRQIGVIVLLAQIGSFVPCSSAEITIVDSILARVGAGDHQLKGISTFAAEMLEAAHILSTATENSLVIIDELGRGTSTWDGFGLAWGISEEIISKKKCFCLFATHFHELTEIVNEHKCCLNRHVKVHVEEGDEKSNGKIVMMYNVVDGPSDKSYGIQVAELANFPKEVIEMARKQQKIFESMEN